MCKAALERMTTGLAAEVYPQHIGVNVISPGLVATPGAVYHNLITEESQPRVTPVEHMAEACLYLVTGTAQARTGAVTYAADVVADNKLQPAALFTTQFCG